MKDLIHKYGKSFLIWGSVALLAIRALGIKPKTIKKQVL